MRIYQSQDSLGVVDRTKSNLFRQVTDLCMYIDPPLLNSLCEGGGYSKGHTLTRQFKCVSSQLDMGGLEGLLLVWEQDPPLLYMKKEALAKVTFDY